MALDVLNVVSKRLQPIAAALICLAFVQLATAIASPEPVPTPVWRVPISR